jgi:hypothetical protein
MVGLSRSVIHQEDGDFLHKDLQTTKNINRWLKSGCDIVEGDASVDIRLLVEFQGEIPAEKNTLFLKST